MQHIIPTHIQIHFAFDTLLYVLYPDLFPEKCDFDTLNLSEQWATVHAEIDRHIPLIPISVLNASNNSTVFIRIWVYLTDFEKKEFVDIPCCFRSLTERIMTDEPIAISQLVPFIETPKVRFSQQQLMKILELHLAVDRLVLEFERELKHGGLFFQSNQSLELLQTYIPKCTQNQAMRFSGSGLEIYNS
jgi:hypothetical protein